MHGANKNNPGPHSTSSCSGELRGHFCYLRDMSFQRFFGTRIVLLRASCQIRFLASAISSCPNARTASGSSTALGSSTTSAPPSAIAPNASSKSAAWTTSWLIPKLSFRASANSWPWPINKNRVEGPDLLLFAIGSELFHQPCGPQDIWIYGLLAVLPMQNGIIPPYDKPSHAAQ